MLKNVIKFIGLEASLLGVYWIGTVAIDKASEKRRMESVEKFRAVVDQAVKAEMDKVEKLIDFMEESTTEKDTTK